MPWFDHPSYRPLRDGLVARFREKAVAFRSLKHIVFLCGGAGSASRRNLLRYLQNWTRDTVLVFEADDVWARISAATTPDVNALQMEAELAELADAVVILVESPGTFAELGAFSNSPQLRRKLLPIVDVRYRDDRSFINAGPVRWIDADSLFRPTLFVPLASVLLSADQITGRLRRIEPTGRQEITDLLSHKKHLLFFMRDIVAVVGPATVHHIERYLAAILPGRVLPSVYGLMGLAESLRLVENCEVAGHTYYYVPPGKRLKAFVRKKYFNLSEERAKVVSVLLKIEAARCPLARMTGAALC